VRRSDLPAIAEIQGKEELAAGRGGECTPWPPGASARRCRSRARPLLFVQATVVSTSTSWSVKGRAKASTSPALAPRPGAPVGGSANCRQLMRWPGRLHCGRRTGGGCAGGDRRGRLHSRGRARVGIPRPPPSPFAPPARDDFRAGKRAAGRRVIGDEIVRARHL